MDVMSVLRRLINGWMDGSDGMGTKIAGVIKRGILNLLKNVGAFLMMGESHTVFK